MIERDVILNELAQGLRPMSQGIEWYDALGPEEQSETLLFLRHHCVQARAVAQDGPESIRRAGLRPTHTPAVLITCGLIDQQLGKIARLASVDERRKAFRLPAGEAGRPAAVPLQSAPVCVNCLRCLMSGCRTGSVTA